MLFVNPRGDEALHAKAHGAIGRFDVRQPHDLEALLRDDYPAIVVRRRALAAEQDEIWYVFRDGRWSPPEGP